MVVWRLTKHTALILLVTGASPSLACPAFMGADSTPEWVQSGAPDHLRLFTIENSGGLPQWKSLPLQIDPMTEAGILDVARTVAPKKEPSAPAPMSKHDRIVFEVNEFGAELSGDMAMPCNTVQLGEIAAPMRPAGRRHAYLALCAPPATAGGESTATAAPIRIGAAPRVRHDQRGQKLVTSFFEYNYLPTNQLLFRTLSARMPDGRWVNAGSDSDFRLRLDLKKFFTLNFTNNDVESYVEATHSGNVGVVGMINFYLRLMMFKIDLKMATIAGFYERSANIPMIVDVPMPANKHLNNGSGMTYTYKLDQTKINPTGYPLSIPESNAELIKKGPSELAKIGLGNCSGEKCVYRLAGAVDTEKFVLDMDIPRTAVENGFFPLYVADVPKFKESMGWKVNKEEDEGRIGFYFENSGLPKGRFQMDYWIRFASAEENSVCPSPAEFKRTLGHPAVVGGPAGKSTIAH